MFHLKQKLLYLFTATFWLSSNLVNAQSSQHVQLDTTFNFGLAHSFFTNPANPVPGIGASYTVNFAEQQADGKLILGGSFLSFNGIARGNLVRLHTDGSVDSTFNTSIAASGAVGCVIIQPDGKLVIGGSFNSYNGVFRGTIARINSNGSLDPTFVTGSGITNGVVNTIALRSDGKLIIAGSFAQYNGFPANSIARLNSNGTFDTTFNVGLGPNMSITKVAIQNDGRILVGGIFASFNGVQKSGIVRLNPNGSLDTTFNMGGIGVQGTLTSLMLQTDGKVMICGDFSHYNGISRRGIARLNSDGSLDLSFNPGSGATFGTTGVARTPNGKLVVTGTFTTFNGQFARYVTLLNSDGSTDSSFSIELETYGFPYIPLVQADGRIVIVGDFQFFDGLFKGRITRLLPNGRNDLTFNPAIGVDNDVRVLELQSNGKILIGGHFVNSNERRKNHLERLNQDGTTDTLFRIGSSADNWVTGIKELPDSTILIAGSFTSFNGVTRNRIARLLPNGNLDQSFDPGVGFNGNVHSMAVQPDGKIVVGGSFTSYRGVQRIRIARLKADGSLDSTFNPGTGFSGGSPSTMLHTIAVQPDGKILVGGNFTTYNAVVCNRIVRLNVDGSRDLTFNQGFGFSDEVLCLRLQSDGKILVGGSFTVFNSVSIKSLARLNPDGSLDPFFVGGIASDGRVSSVAQQLDGKIIIGGTFSYYQGVNRGKLARLNTDGTLDTIFNPVSGANREIWTLAPQANGKLLIGGDFTTFDGVHRPRVARLLTALCTLNVTNSTSTSAICIGQSKSLSGTPGGIWRIATGTGTITGSNFTATGSAGLVSVFNDLNGCWSPLVSFMVEDLPLTPSVPTVPTICAGTTANIIPSGGGISYRFYANAVGGNPLPNGNGVTSFTTPILNNMTTFYVASLNAAGCESDTRAVVTIMVNPSPFVQIVQQGNLLVGNTDSGSFQWYLDTIAILGANTDTFLPTQSGLYTLRVTNGQGCTGISNTINVIMANVNDHQQAQFVWSTYPVPFHERLNISAEQPFSYTLLDLRGAILVQGKSDEKDLILSTAHLASGVYMLRLELNGQTAYKRVVKQ